MLPALSTRHLPRTVIALGAVSLLMDVSSEAIKALLPLFLVTGLGATALTVGLITGVADATVSVTKLFSGAVSDWLGRRKPLLLLGYGLAALTKPIFPAAHAVSTVFAAHVLDRFGKGIRGAPRDALLADVTPPEQRGAAFGLRQSMDTVGAFLGPLLAVVLMLGSGGNIRFVFTWAVIPALLAVLTIVVFVREPERVAHGGARRFPIHREALRRLPASFWSVVAVAALMTLARFSEAFLLLRGEGEGLAPAWVPLIVIVMNTVYALASYPLGALADRMPKIRVLALGVAMLALSHLLLAAGGLPLVFAGVVAWGVHMGATQGLLSALVAEHCPPDLRGTAFGLFNLVSGVAALVASALAGALWTSAGPVYTFAAGAAFAVLTLLALAVRK